LHAEDFSGGIDPGLSCGGGVVMRCALDQWLRHRASSKGAALAFYTAFSIAPILVLVIAVAGFFYGAEAAQGQLLVELKGLLGPKGAEVDKLRNELEDLTGRKVKVDEDYLRESILAPRAKIVAGFPSKRRGGGIVV